MKFMNDVVMFFRNVTYQEKSSSGVHDTQIWCLDWTLLDQDVQQPNIKADPI